MIPAPAKVVLDANVLFPFSLRDTLLRAAAEGYFQVYWSEQILEEARRNLVESATITEAQANTLIAATRKGTNIQVMQLESSTERRDEDFVKGALRVVSIKQTGQDTINE